MSLYRSLAGWLKIVNEVQVFEICSNKKWYIDWLSASKMGDDVKDITETAEYKGIRAIIVTMFRFSVNCDWKLSNPKPCRGPTSWVRASLSRMSAIGCRGRNAMFCFSSLLGRLFHDVVCSKIRIMRARRLQATENRNICYVGRSWLTTNSLSYKLMLCPITCTFFGSGTYLYKICFL